VIKIVPAVTKGSFSNGVSIYIAAFVKSSEIMRYLVCCVDESTNCRVESFNLCVSKEAMCMKNTAGIYVQHIMRMV
jgi:Tfp pilus assembly protein PilV